MAIVGIHDVRKRYAETDVIHGISMDIADGEFIVVVGPSGCGKSTLLRMVAGLESISGGEVSIDREVVNNLEPMDRNIAMVFQNYALYPHMTVFNNMAYGLKNRRTPRDEIDRKVRQAAEILELGQLLDRRPSQLSGGQRQRVAMGRAIVRNPKVFLFDEPLSNLDAKLRVNMRLEIKKLQRRLGITTIYVTHDQVEAMTMADRLVVMNNGIAEQIGTPRDVYRSPATKFVAGFIGSPAMNFVNAVPADDRQSIQAFGARIPVPAGSSLDGVDTISLGVRPEHLKIDGDSSDIRLTVEAVENLGNDTIVYGRTDASEREPIAIRIDGDRDFETESTIGIRLDPEAVHLFDDKTGKRL
jgi:sn-glycerol 3-phosphate transport system ATP-binding protein